MLARSCNHLPLPYLAAAVDQVSGLVQVLAPRSSLAALSAAALVSEGWETARSR